MQLDDRYYQGLNDGYYFQLRFHVYKAREEEHVMHNSDNYDASRSASSEPDLEPGQYIVIKRNSKHKRSISMQLKSNYDVAHAKGLGFAALRAKHAQRERAVAEVKRKAKERKFKEKMANEKEEETGEENDDSDDASDQWNAICVAGLKFYSHDPELELEVRHHPAVDMKGDAEFVRGSLR